MSPSSPSDPLSFTVGVVVSRLLSIALLAGPVLPSSLPWAILCVFPVAAVGLAWSPRLSSPSPLSSLGFSQCPLLVFFPRSFLLPFFLPILIRQEQLVPISQVWLFVCRLGCPSGSFRLPGRLGWCLCVRPILVGWVCPACLAFYSPAYSWP